MRKRTPVVAFRPRRGPHFAGSGSAQGLCIHTTRPPFFSLGAEVRRSGPIELQWQSFRRGSCHGQRRSARLSSHSPWPGASGACPRYPAARLPRWSRKPGDQQRCGRPGPSHLAGDDCSACDVSSCKPADHILNREPGGPQQARSGSSRSRSATSSHIVISSNNFRSPTMRCPLMVRRGWPSGAERSVLAPSLLRCNSFAERRHRGEQGEPRRRKPRNAAGAFPGSRSVSRRDMLVSS